MNVFFYNLGARSECSLCTQWVIKDPSFLQVYRDNSDQIELLPKLI